MTVTIKTAPEQYAAVRDIDPLDMLRALGVAPLPGYTYEIVVSERE